MTSEPDIRMSLGGSRKLGFLHILIPSPAVGAFIGPRGVVISRLQEDTRTKIEVSHRKVFYPGTTERVCLVYGPREGIYAVVKSIMGCVSKNPYAESSLCMHYRKQILYGRRQQVKILVPDSMVSRLVGPQRQVFNEIEQKSGACVRLAPIPEENCLERCLTVAGSKEDALLACLLLIDQVLSVQNVMEETSNVYHSNSKCSVSQNQGSESSAINIPSVLDPLVVRDPQFARPLPYLYSGMQNMSTNVQTIDRDNFLNILQVALSNSHLPAAALARVKDALLTLNMYGVLDICLQIMTCEENRAVYPF